MKRLIFQAAMLLLLPLFAQAKTCDIAPYAIQSPYWPCDAMMRALEPCHEIKISFLAHTFGTETSCLQRVLADRRTTAVEIHLINERCQERPGGCGSYEWIYGLPMREFAAQLRARTPYIMNRVGVFFTEQAGKFLPLIRPETRCWLSPVLESKLSLTEFQPLAEIAYFQFLQKCNLVWNPLQNTGHPGRFIYEVHGSKPRIDPPCISNLDGQDIKLQLSSIAATKKRAFYSNMISEADARRYMWTYGPKCQASFLWVHEENFREKNFQDPRARRPSANFEEVMRRVVALFP